MKKNITKEDAVKAAINTPDLSEISFTLGDKEFKVIDLGYDDYLKFITLLTPMIEVFFGSIANMGGVKVLTPERSIDANAIIKYCGDSLPLLACIVCTQTDPTVTTDDVKNWSIKGTPKGPFKLAEVVLKQIEKNNIIGDFAGFFVQMLPMMKAALKLNQ